MLRLRHLQILQRRVLGLGIDSGDMTEGDRRALLDALADGKIDSPGGSACRIYKGLFTHIKDTVEDIMAKKPDMNAYNGFIKDAILNRLINPQ